MQYGGCIYILTNATHSVMYIGVTADLTGRVWEHKMKVNPSSFTAKYHCNKLVYYCFYPRIEEAIAAEKVLKGGNRKAKQELVGSFNPLWKDLYDDLISH